MKKPDDYLWSSYRAFTGSIKGPHWLETEWLLSKFGSNRKQATRAYRDFVEKVDLQALKNPHEHLVGGFILGNTSFADWVKKTFLAVRRDEKETISYYLRCDVDAFSPPPVVDIGHLVCGILPSFPQGLRIAHLLILPL